ncbi:helix-turn-helix transcriptional regulator [Spirochaeta cellobiosiphila]|uniref:helix-turn-helix transcriptional regulator n=1 Tax=Spirochaeta cellobiosiphila TaxID=504483 RepID=UPI000418C29A|nr:AraC family transcriptional regulator [Spirochaeta cellobiosiphila]
MKLYFFIRKISLGSRGFDLRPIGEKGQNEIIYCLTGQGELYGKGEKPFPVTKGTILLNPVGKFHGQEEDFQLVHIIFSEELFMEEVSMGKQALFILERIKDYDRDPLYIYMSNIGTERMNSLVDSMLWEFKNRYRGYSWAIRLKLIELLITVIRDKRFKVPLEDIRPPQNTHIQEVVDFLNREYQNQITVEDILDFCPLSRSHFHALFKQETGQTLVDYLNTVRCREARNQLLLTDKKIIDIGTDCGFNNLSHFYHIFKKKMGHSPRQLRLLESKN